MRMCRSRCMQSNVNQVRSGLAAWDSTQTGAGHTSSRYQLSETGPSPSSAVRVSMEASRWCVAAVNRVTFSGSSLRTFTVWMAVSMWPSSSARTSARMVSMHWIELCIKHSVSGLTRPTTPEPRGRLGSHAAAEIGRLVFAAVCVVATRLGGASSGWGGHGSSAWLSSSANGVDGATALEEVVPGGDDQDGLSEGSDARREAVFGSSRKSEIVRLAREPPSDGVSGPITDSVPTSAPLVLCRGVRIGLRLGASSARVAVGAFAGAVGGAVVGAVGGAVAGAVMGTDRGAVAGAVAGAVVGAVRGAGGWHADKVEPVLRTASLELEAPEACMACGCCVATRKAVTQAGRTVAAQAHQASRQRQLLNRQRTAHAAHS